MAQVKNKKKTYKKEPYLPKDGSEDPHPLLIPLQNYHLRHDTFKEAEINERDSDFIGRKNLINQLSQLLENTKNKRGSYLVAGYRGSGKTSLINHVVKKYEIEQEKRKNEVLPVRINLGHDEVLDARHVLFNIISSLRSEFDLYFQKIDHRFNDILKFVVLLIYILTTLSLLNSDYFTLIKDIFNSIRDIFSLKIKYIDISNLRIHILLLISFITFILTLKVVRGFLWDAILFFQLNAGKKSKYHLYKNIDKLYCRVAYSFEKEIGLLKNRPGFGFRNKTLMPEMKEPQMELEIINLLDQCHEVDFDIILIFDELDKISLKVTESSLIDDHNPPKQRATDHLYDETLHENIYRRKKRVDSLLASLKTLITVGKARFFFIAGRDMLDSYQSEKGSTSSLYESLFNQVFEVPSFLSDNSDQDKIRLHSMIEVYICSRLLDQETATQYFLANRIWDDVIEKLKESDINIHDKFIAIIKKFEENNDLKEKEIELKSLLQSIEKCLPIYKFLSHKKLIKKLIKISTNSDEEKNETVVNEEKNETVVKQQLSILKEYTREWVKKNKNIELLKCHLSLDLSEDGVYEKSIIYPVNKLNTYYHYLLDNLESEIDAKVVINRLRYFVNYLTVHSWGNCKRLASLFESFTIPITMIDSVPNAMNWLPIESSQKEKTQYMLHFGVTETQRISMGSNLYIMFNHHLSRQFTGADKLVVSTLAALHYCLKFHRSAFSRHHLSRMTEMMSIYSSPELTSIFETTLTQVLWPYIREVRNGMFRYRFFTWIEQEIRYIARVNDLESASYTFSLDAINDIKAHYRKTLANVMETYDLIKNCSDERAPGLIAEINIVLGDIYFLERSYDEAVVYYQTAVNAHHSLNNEQNYHLECLLRFVEALLKLGNVQEHRQRYERAAMNYYQAQQLVNDFLNQQKKSGDDSFLNKRIFHFPRNGENISVTGLLKDGDPKWVLLKQPYWAFLYLNIKRGHVDYSTDSISPYLYGKIDPYRDYHPAQLCFYTGKYGKAEKYYLSIINKLNNVGKPAESEVGNTNEQYYSSYLMPKACINLALNSLVKKMQELSIENFHLSDSWEDCRTTLTKKCWDLLKTMNDVTEITKLNLEDNFFEELQKKDIDMKKMLQLIFYAAKQYERYKLFDHAAMAYLQAISVWVISIDMLPLNYLEDTRENKDNDELKEQREGLKYLTGRMYDWLDEISTKALRVIMDSNGQAIQQSREKWHYRDLDKNFDKFSNSNSIAPNSYKKLIHLHLSDDNERNKLNDDIAFWQGSYLGQQLIAILNWAYTIKRTLSKDDPSPINSYRIPPYTTRSLITSSWANGRERLEQARRYRIYFEHEINKGKCECTTGEEFEKEYKKIKDFVDKCTLDFREKHKNNGNNGQLEIEDCYYIISAKSIHNFYTALQYTRILVDNNQAIIIPPPGFVTLNLWRGLFRLVQYEKSRTKGRPDKEQSDYETSRILVRDKLMKYVSHELPTSHLDLDYVAAEAIRQLRALSTMSNASSTARFNIVHNKFYLNDDFEDPGFQLDWTLVQALIPSSLMLMKWVEEEMRELKG